MDPGEAAGQKNVRTKDTDQEPEGKKRSVSIR